MKSFFLLLIFHVSLLSVAQINSCNCCTENNAQFDFWIGDWTVTDPQGNLAGTNHIKKAQDNCVLIENWKSAKGNFTGTSYNFYNNKSQQWEQIWIDNQGGHLHLKGNKIKNRMVLKSDEQTDASGNIFYHQITWTLNTDGSVRQFWEMVFKDKTTVAFDGLYIKDVR